jgi:hypothetical protein
MRANPYVEPKPCPCSGCEAWRTAPDVCGRCYGRLVQRKGDKHPCRCGKG